MHETSVNQKIEKAIHEAVNDGTMILVFDKHGVIRYVNPRFLEVSQYDAEEIIEATTANFFTADFYQIIKNTIEKNQKWTGEVIHKKKDGTRYWTDSSITPIVDKKQGHKYVLLQQDITKRKTYEHTLEELVFTDPLTKLPNRNYMKFWMKKKHEPSTEITVFFIDIDRFKTINDNFGHAIGDRVLQTVAERLEKSLEENMSVFRYNGEEFIVLLENKTLDTINQSLQKILEMIQEPILIDQLQLYVTASIGISKGYPFLNGENTYSIMKDLINKADTAVYYAKRQGKSKFHFHSNTQNREVDRKFQMQLEIREALERKEFSLEYQPLINLKTNKIVGVESLLRWNNRLLGKIPPNEFIPLLEDTGLIIPVGKWILRTVCEQMKSWQEQGLYLQRISVNVSPIQFRDPNFVSDLKNIVDEVELDASYLELEITESTLLDIENSAKKLNDLQQMGVKVSIDDFGTGYSSLSYLKQLPIDTLKIDKSFISDLDRDGKIIVNTIISMGKNLQFRVIAEGIENSDQFKYLKQQQCHEGQGYFFSRPVASHKIEEIYYSLQ